MGKSNETPKSIMNQLLILLVVIVAMLYVGSLIIKSSNEYEKIEQIKKEENG